MIHLRKLILLVSAMLLITGCSNEKALPTKSIIAVSIMPQVGFVKAVGGDKVNVLALIPPGASPANYQPTPKQMRDFSDAKVYFTIGVAAEAASILPNMSEQNDEIQIIKLDEAVDNVYEPRYFDAVNETGRDPHIWMSPKRVIVMIEVIRDELSRINPENESYYKANAQEYIKNLNEMDDKIAKVMAEKKNKKFIITHPSLGYFAADYGLEMLAIEEDGKKTSAQRLGEIVEFAKENDIHVVLYQQEFDSEQAATLAAEIGGRAVAYEPLAENYLENLATLIEVFQSMD